jgi:hypothetical protein
MIMQTYSLRGDSRTLSRSLSRPVTDAGIFDLVERGNGCYLQKTAYVDLNNYATKYFNMIKPKVIYNIQK